MWGKKDESSNPFISWMEMSMQTAIDGIYLKSPCAEEIVPMIKDFFKKSMSANIKWDDNLRVPYHVEDIADIVTNLAHNTRSYERFTDEDMSSFIKIFNELDALREEALLCYSQFKYKYDLSSKISCISEMIKQNMLGTHDSLENHKNWRDGMIFQSYENLWKVIHRVNTEWEELCGRGFSLRVFYDYRDAFEYDRRIGQEQTEDEKLKTFMALLDGTMKFVPVYEHKAVCFKVVENDFKEVVTHTFENRYDKPYRLRQEGEKITQCEATEN